VIRRPGRPPVPRGRRPELIGPVEEVVQRLGLAWRAMVPPDERVGYAARPDPRRRLRGLVQDLTTLPPAPLAQLLYV